MPGVCGSPHGQLTPDVHDRAGAQKLIHASQPPHRPNTSDMTESARHDFSCTPLAPCARNNLEVNCQSLCPRDLCFGQALSGVQTDRHVLLLSNRIVSPLQSQIETNTGDDLIQTDPIAGAQAPRDILLRWSASPSTPDFLKPER